MTMPGLANTAALIASWATASVLATALLVAVAIVLHRLLRGAVPQRLLWSAALATSAALTATQPWRRSGEPGVAVAPAATVVTDARVTAAESPGVARRAVTLLRTAPAVAARLVSSAARRVGSAARTAPTSLQWGLVLGWPLGTVLLLGIGGWSYRRQRQALRHAGLATVAGRAVSVTSDTGPAVFGVVGPRIVVPAWLFTRPPQEQHLVVQHEQAHIDAGDPQLLLGACALVALTPWNPGAWYLLSRLRLAIELDCDARVLQGATTPGQYGALLIDLSAAARPLPPLTGAPAFSHRASHLERRLHHMTEQPTTHRMPRRLMGAAAATLALVTACGTELPTSAELEGMDVAAATERLAAVAPSAARRYVIDGRAATEVEAMALPASRLASIEVMKAERGVQTIRLSTRPAAASATASAPASVAGTVPQGEPAAPVVSMTIRQIDSTTTALRIANRAAALSAASAIAEGAPASTTARRAFDGLVFVDGVKSDEGALQRLSPSQIETVEVIKGEAAEKTYGPDGAKGVIRITTRK